MNFEIKQLQEQFESSLELYNSNPNLDNYKTVCHFQSKLSYTLKFYNNLQNSINNITVINLDNFNLFSKVMQTKGLEATALIWLEWWFQYKNALLFEDANFKNQMIEIAEKNSFRLFKYRTKILNS